MVDSDAFTQKMREATEIGQVFGASLDYVIGKTEGLQGMQEVFVGLGDTMGESMETGSAALEEFYETGQTTFENLHELIQAGIPVHELYAQLAGESLEAVSATLNEMHEAGEVTMESLQVLIEAGIPVYELYAQAAGESLESVKAAFAKGQVAAGEFVPVLASALQFGMERFPSLARVSEAAGSAWRGAFGGMKSDTASWASAVQSDFGRVAGTAMPALYGSTTRVTDAMATLQGETIQATAAINALQGGTAQLDGAMISISTSSASSEKNVDGFTKTVDRLTQGLQAAKDGYSAWETIEKWKKALMGGEEASKTSAKAVETLLEATTENTEAQTVASTIAEESAAAEGVRTAAKQAAQVVEESALAVKEAGNKAAEESIQAANDETLATQQSTTALTGKQIITGLMTGQISLATAATHALNAATSIGLVGALTLAVTIIKGLIDWFSKSKSAMEKQAEVIAEVKSEYEGLAAEAETTEGKLKDVNGRLEELQRFETLTLAEKEEVAELERAHGELEAILAIQERQADLARQELEKETVEALNQATIAYSERDVGFHGRWPSWSRAF